MQQNVNKQFLNSCDEHNLISVKCPKLLTFFIPSPVHQQFPKVLLDAYFVAMQV